MNRLVAAAITAFWLGLAAPAVLAGEAPEARQPAASSPWPSTNGFPSAPAATSARSATNSPQPATSSARPAASSSPSAPSAGYAPPSPDESPSTPAGESHPPAPPPPPPGPSDLAPGGVTLDLPAFDYIAAFITPTEGGVLRAEETGWFRVELRNLEDREFKQVRVAYKALTPVEGLPAAGSAVIETFGPHERQVVTLPVASTRAVPNGQVDYVLEVLAAGGAYGPPARITFRTRAFVAPRLEILAVDQRIQGDRVVVKAQIQNLGGTARDVSARFMSADPDVMLESSSFEAIGDLPGGQVREVMTAVALGTRSLPRPQVPLWLEVRERHEDLGIRERLTINLGENETLTKSATASPP